MDWRVWVARWDRMQARYLVRRAERFAVLAGLVRATQGPAPRIVDLGCGPGSLSEALLEALPDAEVWGVDVNESVLLLARPRLAAYGERVHVVRADLRQASWVEQVPAAVDAVVSATALHWLLPGALRTLYGQVARLLVPGGLFANADHVGSAHAAIQGAWERAREAQVGSAPDDWSTFWRAYGAALGRDLGDGGWEEGVEEGMPLAWHLDALRACGFASVDCFWRCDCDAIYGGVR
ncbi:MAG: class I SAM-dependent methyltransferase [Anaerolineae bacterium]|nr:class I SAM-dependent methyltransferase [Anaerolineae bacterium]